MSTWCYNVHSHVDMVLQCLWPSRHGATMVMAMLTWCYNIYGHVDMVLQCLRPCQHGDTMFEMIHCI